MKTKEMLMIFALAGALSLAVASSPRHAISDMGTPSASPSSLSAVRITSMPLLGLLQQEPAPPVQTAPEKKDVDVTVRTETREWYVSPVWVAIGILAAIVLVLLIAMAVRGGRSDTTRIVHE